MRLAPYREWRIVQCVSCWFRDFYRLTQSYPPRCPQCGESCVSDFALQERIISPDELRLYGRDIGHGREFKRAPGVPIRRARRAGWA